jgi:cell division protein FtsQ
VAVRRSSSPRARTAVLAFPGGRGAVRLSSILPSARALAAAVLLAGIGGGAYAAARATWLFEIEAVEVRGASPTTAREVRAALAPLLGQSLLGLDGGALVDRVEAIPEVAGADYDRAFPHTLVVAVREEVPAAVLRSGARAWLVAASGRVLRLLAADEPASLPRVWVSKREAVAPGRPVRDHVAAGAVAAVAHIPDGFPARVRDVRTRPDELTFKLASGLELRLGDASEVELKLVIAGRILRALAAPADGGPAYLDVSVVERPVAGTSLNSKVEVEG